MGPDEEHLTDLPRISNSASPFPQEGDASRAGETSSFSIPYAVQPMLIIAPTEDSNEIVAELEALHMKESIDTRVVSIESSDYVDLQPWHFGGVHLVLPDPSGWRLGDGNVVYAQAMRDVAVFQRFLERYRVYRPKGLEAARASRLRWWEVGVVQVFGRRAIVNLPSVRNRLREADVMWSIDDMRTLDPSRVFHRDVGSEARLDVDPVLPKVVAGARRRLAEWGLNDISDIRRMKSILEEEAENMRRASRRSERAPYAPEDGRSALEIVLSGHTPPVADERLRKLRIANLAAAALKGVEAVRKNGIDFSYPKNVWSDKTRRLHEIYIDAKMIIKLES